MRKTCIKCKERKFLKDFSFRDSSHRRRRNECRKCMWGYQKDWLIKNPKKLDRQNLNIKNIEHNLRLQALVVYGGSPPRCQCCDTDIIEFLCIDHIDGGGNKHRKELNITKISRWLKKENYPKGFRVLCYNCNFSLGANGYCPHPRIEHDKPAILKMQRMLKSL